MATTPTRVPVASPRWAAAVAATGLALMAILAPYALFVGVEGVVVPGDPAATVENLVVSERLFRTGIAAFLVVVLLDLVVAWALHILFKRVDARLSLLAAWLRLAYAAVLAAALANLFDALLLATASASASVPDGSGLGARVMGAIASFHNGWDIGLAIFGLHLLCIGLLAFRSGFIPRLLAVLLTIAGAGYLADSFGAILVPEYGLGLSSFTFVGEALFIPWLFWLAAEKRSDGARVAAAQANRREANAGTMRDATTEEPHR